MELEKLKLEKEKIVNLQNNYFDKLLSKINEYEKEVKNYKLMLKNLENKINQLTLDIKLKDEEVVENKRKITELRSELTKAEDEICNLRAMNPYTKLELIKDLKEAYIRTNDDEAEGILDEILEQINIIEDKISEDDMMVIIYLSYIYDRLQVILGTSSIANNYYSSLNKEAKLLNIISQEENCKPYASMDECTQSYISKEKDLFKKLDIKLKKRIIETLYDMSYKTFNEVYKESYMELGDSTVNIKAWVKEENDLSWKLISGIYSYKNDRIYLPENMIKVLGVKLNKSQGDIDEDLLNLKIREIKEMFLAEEYEILKTYMEFTSGDKAKNIFIELANFDITLSTIAKENAYNLLLIASFYSMQNILINKSSYLKEIYHSETMEGKLIRRIVNELKVSEGSKVDLPITIFLMYNKDKIISIEEDIKRKAFKLINLYFYDKFDNIIVSKNNNFKNCRHDKNYLRRRNGYLESSNISGDKKYYLLRDKSCDECNTVYINIDKYNKINDELIGYKLSPAKIEIIESNNELKSNANLEKVKKYKTLYNSLLEYFIQDNLGKSLLTFNNIIEDINALKYYNRIQKITLLFIGYLIKKSTFGATKIMSSGDIGVSTDTILYKKLSEGRNYIGYLTKYRDSLELIDPKVKNEIIVKLTGLYKEGGRKYKTTEVINKEDFDGGKLNAESEIKKMGYSTSLSRMERWRILKDKAVPKLGKAKVIGHIRFLIKMNKNRSGMFNAVSEWEYDLEKLYKL